MTEEEKKAHKLERQRLYREKNKDKINAKRRDRWHSGENIAVKKKSQVIKLAEHKKKVAKVKIQVEKRETPKFMMAQISDQENRNLFLRKSY